MADVTDDAEAGGARGVVPGPEESHASLAERGASGPVLDSAGSREDAGREGALTMLRSQPGRQRKTRRVGGGGDAHG